MNNASKFRAIPKSGSFTIPFKLEETALLNWLIDLNQGDSKEACTQTLSLLQTLNKTELTFKNRFVFLKLINEYLKQYMTSLPGSCWEAGFPLSLEESVYAEMVAWNCLLLAEGFFIAADTANKKHDAVLSLAMALQTLGQAQLHIAATYSVPCDGFWQQLYQVFAWAEKKKLQHLPIDDHEFKGLTINALFARNLIFQVCDTNQFQAREMRTIFNFLPKVCVDLAVAPHSETAELCMLDLKSDNPPMNVKRQVELGSDLVRYFSPVIVADALHQIIAHGETWSGTLKLINNTLFARVAKTLGLKQKRQYHRKKECHSLLGVISFEDIIGFLYKATKNPPFEPSAIAKTPAATPQNISPYTENSNTKAGYTLLEKAEDSQLKQTQVAPKKTIWQQNKSISEIPIKKVSLKEIRVCDSSANGYSVSWSQSHTRTKIGDLFGIISEDKKRLEVAIIRRIAVMGNEHCHCHVKFGAELLGFESELVYLSDNANENVGIWAVFIPGIELLEQPDTLVYSTGHFNVGEIIELHKGNQTISALLRKELHATVAISHVELAYPKLN